MQIRLGISPLVVAAVAQKPLSLPLAKRAIEKTDMSYEDLFKFSYDSMILVLKNLSDQIDRLFTGRQMPMPL
jgi:hypothetical protein